MNKKIIFILIVILILVSGCAKRYTQEELEWEVMKARRNAYELGKIVGEFCDDEIVNDIYERAYKNCIEETKDNVYDRCLLVVTDGDKPNVPNHYDYEVESFFPIRTLDFETDSIEGYGDNFNETHILWKYWMICKN